MNDVFISYSSKDRGRAETLAKALESRGWDVWWDREIIAGQAFDKVIEERLEAARCVVVLWSEYSISSEWVKNEAASAAQRGVLVPALLDRVIIPLEFRRKQTVDLVGWEGDVSDAAFHVLCRGISANVTGSADPLPSPARLTVTSRRRHWILGGMLVVAAAVLTWIFHEHVFPNSNEFLGTVEAMKGAQALPPIPLRVSLHIAGALVTGEYDNDSGDKGVLNGTIDGNSLDLHVVSFNMGGDCSLKGMLTDRARKLDAIYTCPDGEHGKFTLVRK